MRTALLRGLLTIAASAALAAIAFAVPAGAQVSGLNGQFVFTRSSPAQRTAPSRSLPSDVLTGVSATSAANAWAVGYYTISGVINKTLILQWNGSTKTWSLARKIHNPSMTDNKLYGVIATSASNAWAVGYYRSDKTGNDQSLILHWNGTGWSPVKIKNLPSTGNNLTAVSASSASNAWAVGTTMNQSLILHWNGTAWSRVGIKSLPATANQLSGVTAASRSDAWAAGYYFTSTNTTKTLILHWNGTAWSQVTNPPPPSPSRTGNVLSGVRATSAANAWAVGIYTDNTTARDDALIVRWNGSTWSNVDSIMNLPAADNYLNAVSASSASSAWAAGDSCTNTACTTSNTLIVGWNGTAWKRFNSPNASTSATSHR